MEKIYTNRGGKRQNAGRKKAEPTKTFYCRIPKSIYAELSEYVHEKVKEHKSK